MRTSSESRQASVPTFQPKCERAHPDRSDLIERISTGSESVFLLFPENWTSTTIGCRVVHAEFLCAAATPGSIASATKALTHKLLRGNRRRSRTGIMRVS